MKLIKIFSFLPLIFFLFQTTYSFEYLNKSNEVIKKFKKQSGHDLNENQKKALKGHEEYIKEIKSKSLSNEPLYRLLAEKGVEESFTDDSGCQINMIFHLAHLILPYFGFKKNFDTGESELCIIGGHQEYYLKELARHKVCTIDKKKSFDLDDQGSKCLTIKHPFSENVERKTVFPGKYSDKDIKRAIYEAYQNCTYFEEVPKSNDRHKVIGNSCDNIKIEMIIKIINNKKIEVISAYPVK